MYAEWAARQAGAPSEIATIKTRAPGAVREPLLLRASATGDSSISVGSGAHSKGYMSIAFGDGVVVEDDYGVCVRSSATVGRVPAAVAIDIRYDSPSISCALRCRSFTEKSRPGGSASIHEQ